MNANTTTTTNNKATSTAYETVLQNNSDIAIIQYLRRDKNMYFTAEYDEATDMVITMNSVGIHRVATDVYIIKINDIIMHDCDLSSNYDASKLDPVKLQAFYKILDIYCEIAQRLV